MSNNCRIGLHNIDSECINSHNPYRFGFNGKELDNEVKGVGNSIDFGARVYDSRLARFLSVDPLMKDYPMMTPYCFAANNPIRLIDINGEAPGDPFETEEEAAIDFAMTYNDNSIKDNREYASVIYSYTDDYGKTMYSYMIPIRGTKYESSSPILKVPDKKDVLFVADIHTHGAYEERIDWSDTGEPDWNNNFSDDSNPRNLGDLQISKKYNMKIYCVTSNGSLLVFNPKETDPKVRSIDTDGSIPSDKSDPTQLPGVVKSSGNNVRRDSRKYPKNEPYYKNKRHAEKGKESKNKSAKPNSVPSYEPSN